MGLIIGCAIMGPPIPIGLISVAIGCIRPPGGGGGDSGAYMPGCGGCAGGGDAAGAAQAPNRG